jgi:hypothetical protein
MKLCYHSGRWRMHPGEYWTKPSILQTFCVRFVDIRCRLICRFLRLVANYIDTKSVAEWPLFSHLGWSHCRQASQGFHPLARLRHPPGIVTIAF